MSSLLGRFGSRHDIDTEVDSATLESLPHGLMQHHAFSPHMWRKGEPVTVTSADGIQYGGRVADVSMKTGRVLIMIVGKIPAKR